MSNMRALLVALVALTAPHITNALLDRCDCPIQSGLQIAMQLRTVHPTPIDHQFLFFPNSSSLLYDDDADALLAQVLAFCLRHSPIGQCASMLYAEACRTCRVLSEEQGTANSRPPPRAWEAFTPRHYFGSYLPSLNNRDWLDVLHLGVHDALTRPINGFIPRTVLDLDLGSGFLAARAVQAGAQHVTVVMPYGRPLQYLLRQSLIDNIGLTDFTSKLSFVDRSALHTLPDHSIDLITWEPQMAPDVLGAQVSLLSKATRRVLSPRGRVVPASGRIHMMLIHMPNLEDRLEVTTACGFNVTGFNKLNGFENASPLGSRDYLAVSAAHGIVDMHFNTLHTVAPGTHYALNIPITETTLANGIVWWMDIHVDGPAGSDHRYTFPMGPHSANGDSTRQRPSVVPLPSRAQVAVGDVAQVILTVDFSGRSESNPWLNTLSWDVKWPSGSHVIDTRSPTAATAVASDGSTSSLGENYRIPDWHFTMVNDVPRNEAYRRGLEAVVKPTHTVLDIGSGSGLLAMIAARAGAQDVHTVEVEPGIAGAAVEIVRQNGLAETVTVHNMFSTDLTVGKELPRRANVLVTEIWSSDLFEEGLYSTLNHALEHLTVTPEEGLIVVPHATTMYAMPVESRDVRVHGHVEPHPGAPLPHNTHSPPYHFNIDTVNNGIVSLAEWMHQNRFLSVGPPQKVFTWDLTHPIPEWTFVPWTVTAQRSGVIDGIAYWWDMDFADGSVFTMDPIVKHDSLSYHWTQNFHLVNASTPVVVGQKVDLAMAFWRGKTAFNVTGVRS